VQPGVSVSTTRITSVEALHLRLSRVEEKADGTQEVLLVRVVTDTGLVGHGEAVSNSTVARSIIEAPRSAPFRHGLAVTLTGADPLDPEARWLDMYNATRWYGRRGAAIHAMAAVDTALWDIVGQSRSLACHAVWGTRRRRFPAYASVLFPDTIAEGAALAASLVERGFKALKFGWGRFGYDRDWDCRMLGEIRAAIGSDIDLMVDVGRIWRAEEAVARAPELFECFSILWLEEPLHEDDIQGYGILATSLRDGYPGARVAAGETEERESDFVSLLDKGVRVIQPDVGRAGGLSLCRRLSTIAHSRGAWCLPHCFGTGVNLAASAQWMAAAEAAPFMEYPFTHSPLRNELVAGIPRMVDGMVEVGDGPGLGITLDPTVIARYRVD
jgi:L-rhamnonate dehydratase